MRTTPITHSAMARLGWQRTDPRPWGKLNATWVHVSGWRLEHCGHPTALTPWALYSPAGEMVLTGAAISGNPKFGTAWPSLAMASSFVAEQARVVANG